MQRFDLFRILAVFAISITSMANAAGQENFDQKYGSMISDEVAMQAIKAALTKIGKATCEANTPCAPESPEDSAHPPISVIDGRAAMVFAIKSALAQWCGLDWKRSFLPMVAFGKKQMKMTDRQMQLMTLIHGDFMGRQLMSYSKSGQCPAKVRDQLDAQLPRLNR